MGTDDWLKPEDDVAEQAAAVEEPDEAPARPSPGIEADEADTLEQNRELPEEDEYRDA